MSKLGTTGLTKLIQLIKANTVSSTDVEQCTEVTIDSTPTASSTNLVTSGGVHTAMLDKVNYQDIVSTTGQNTNKVMSQKAVTDELATKVTALIKTVIDQVLVPQAQYYLGEQTTLSLTLPSTASAGQIITVDFDSGATATTLTISGNVIGDITYAPSTNKAVELSFKYDNQRWKMLKSELDIPVVSE